MRQLVVIISIFALSMLSGCATIEKSNAKSTEQRLSVAGFTMKLADTPEKLAHLKTLTQRKVVPHDRDGKTHFVYADALYCECLYVGNEEAYQRYEKMVFQQNIANMNMDASMNWGMWGPWGGW